jgi:hypothetical protein
MVKNMIYEILDDNGSVINTIVAELDFVEQVHPGRYREQVLSAEEQAAANAAKDAMQAANVRQQRNDKLKDSDWTQVADAPVDQAAWAAYRQQLRDITSQAGFPWTIEWPEQP